jgi:hypothetical protein
MTEPCRHGAAPAGGTGARQDDARVAVAPRRPHRPRARASDRAIARLDQALAGHPLVPALLYRARLDAARRAAAVDGHGIDPWHLAAVLEGLRLRMDPSLSMLDRGAIFDAARHAFDQYQWLVTPDFYKESEVQAAEKVLATAPGQRRCWLVPGACTPGSIAAATGALAGPR